MHTFAPVKTTQQGPIDDEIVSCGVMVARRILVPPVGVRIPPRQRRRIELSLSSPFSLYSGSNQPVTPTSLPSARRAPHPIFEDMCSDMCTLKPSTTPITPHQSSNVKFCQQFQSSSRGCDCTILIISILLGHDKTIGAVGCVDGIACICQLSVRGSGRF